MKKKSKIMKKKARKVRIKPRPLSQGFLLIGLLGVIVTTWLTYFEIEIKPGVTLPLSWGMTLIIFFVILIIASFRSLEIS